MSNVMYVLAIILVLASQYMLLKWIVLQQICVCYFFLIFPTWNKNNESKFSCQRQTWIYHWHFISISDHIFSLICLIFCLFVYINWPTSFMDLFFFFFFFFFYLWCTCPSSLSYPFSTDVLHGIAFGRDHSHSLLYIRNSGGDGIQLGSFLWAFNIALKVQTLDAIFWSTLRSHVNVHKYINVMSIITYL